MDVQSVIVFLHNNWEKIIYPLYNLYKLIILLYTSYIFKLKLALLYNISDYLLKSIGYVSQFFFDKINYIKKKGKKEEK